HPPTRAQWEVGDGLQVHTWPSYVYATATFPDGQRSTKRVKITTTGLPTGGLRAWFLCPGCGRRCGRLYLTEERASDYRCRLCLGLAYHIQYRRGLRAEIIRMFRKWLAEERCAKS